MEFRDSVIQANGLLKRPWFRVSPGTKSSMTSRLTAICCTGALTDDMGFRFVADGEKDAVVRLVRLVKWP